MKVATPAKLIRSSRPDPTMEFLTSENFKAALTVVILIAAVYGFVSEKIPPDVTSLLALLGLLLIGVLTPIEAFSGFSHPATVSVAAVLVLSAAIERTGALEVLARRLITMFGRYEFLFTAAIMLLIGLLSAFVNNTAAVAIFIPVVIEVCRRRGFSPGRVLMPMSHAATFGGMCTLIGTSTNLVAHEFARSKGLPGFAMFELGKVGFPMLIAGSAYILLVGRWLLPHNRPAAPMGLQSAGSYLIELLVRPESRWIERAVSVQQFEHDFDVELLGVVRDGQVLGLEDPRPRYEAGDSLRVRGSLERVLHLAAQEGLEPHRPRESQIDLSLPTAAFEAAAIEKLEAMPPTVTGQKLALAEVVVLSTSGLIGQTLKEARFAERYDAVVLALRRKGGIRGRVSTTPLHAGDVLVVEGHPQALEALAETSGFLVIGTPAHPEQKPGKLAITLLTLVAVITVASFGLLPIVTAATAGCAVLMLTGCLRPREAYRAIDLGLVFILAGSLALGLALEKTGITSLLGKGLAGLSGNTGPYLVLIGFFIVAVIVSELMSNGGTVALLGPVALSVATQMGINPMAPIAAVTFGASAAFAMPMGYQTSLMIYGPGGYRVRDFVKMGIPLDLILAALALLLIPYYWPLVTP
jgi:di/tricarboxylate transporter